MDLVVRIEYPNRFSDSVIIQNWTRFVPRLRYAARGTEIESAHPCVAWLSNLWDACQKSLPRKTQAMSDGRRLGKIWWKSFSRVGSGKPCMSPQFRLADRFRLSHPGLRNLVATRVLLGGRQFRQHGEKRSQRRTRSVTGIAVEWA